MHVPRHLLLSCALMAVLLAESLTGSAGASDTAEEGRPRILLRKRRTTDLPSSANIRFESKLTIPQPPTGLYQIWFGPVRFFIQPLFPATRWVRRVRSGLGQLTRPGAAGRGQDHGRPADLCRLVAERDAGGGDTGGGGRAGRGL